MYVEGGIAVNSQAFQVTYEQRVQALLQDAVNLVKAFFDSAVHAMNVEADDVGRSAILNEGMINVNSCALMMHLLGSAPNGSTGATTRRNNIISKKELDMANFGAKSGPAYQFWVSDVKTITELVDELMGLSSSGHP